MVLVDPSHENQDERTAALLPPDLRRAWEEMTSGTADPEGFDLAASGDQVRAARATAPLRSMPLVVLTHGRADPAGLLPGWPIDAEEQLWRDLHADLAALVPGGDQLIAEGSGHFIQTEQPELVITAVRDVLADLPA